MKETLPNLTLKQLHYFSTVARAGSIALAAEKLRIASPSISSAIKTLEGNLNIELFVRHHARGVSLTAAGHELLQQTTQLLANTQNMEDWAKTVAEEPSGVVSIGCYPTLAPILMPTLVSRVQNLYPKITLNFVEKPEKELFAMLENGQIDLALCYSDCLPEQVLKTVLQRIKPHCLLSADHPLALQADVSLQDLKDEPMVLLDTDPSRHRFLGLFQDLNFAPYIKYSVASFEVLRGLVGQGLGYALLVTKPNSIHAYDGSMVVQKPIRDDIAECEVCLVRMPANRMPMAIQAIQMLCKSICAELGQAENTSNVLFMGEKKWKSC